MDITQLILDDHHQQRRLFALLDEIDRADRETLGLVWNQLADFLEVHAEAEERHFYPSLLRHGQGAGSKADAKGETIDAISDHNDIRDAIARAGQHEVGSDGWFDAVAAARKANSTHMGEEERESLADFRRHAPLQARHELAVRFAAFEAAHRGGIDARDKDPQAYVRRAGG
ncbi:hemerythrin domain-containing protein [Frateuria terrea]|uniref:Hemerythrin HHE cation binding domain-containing protein n=1 Tax=Frateuria terrea TaxID=529704 RepID=A0A1H6QNV7_9GAMM|nr:hemerythrin domain-containing protein [Frateuria terrea]SEI45468.1 Hemerythrin HHE cation binding domain-containing protein [Frateuria terrea]SFP11241.1 Hemerythrin HHE cation binding domain-containing protein [Frateuria terrea]